MLDRHFHIIAVSKLDKAVLGIEILICIGKKALVLDD